MSVISFCILVAVVAKCQSISVIEADNRTLKAVAVLYRHGDRAPIDSYPDDPYFDKQYWPEGYGELLKAGKLRQYELGAYLRDRYANFLSEEYSKDEIYVRSSDVDRTLVSAASNLAGLYARNDDNIFNKNLNWNPIPIHTVPKEDDTIIYMGKDCPKYNQFYVEIAKNQYNEFLEENPEIIEIISNETSWPKDQIDFEMLYGTFYCYQMANESYIPNWYGQLDTTVFKNFAGRQFIKENTTELKRLGTGPFITYLTHYFDNIVKGDGPKFLMLSGHDQTIAAVLNAMEVYDYNPPEFASTVIWELYQEGDDKHTIEVFYKINSTSEPYMLNVTADYESFKEFVEPLLINEFQWSSECNFRPSSSSTISISLINLFVMAMVMLSF